MNMYEVKTRLMTDIGSYQLGVKFRERLQKERKMTPEQKMKMRELIEDIETNFSPYLNEENL